MNDTILKRRMVARNAWMKRALLHEQEQRRGLQHGAQPVMRWMKPHSADEREYARQWILMQGLQYVRVADRADPLPGPPRYKAFRGWPRSVLATANTNRWPFPLLRVAFLESFIELMEARRLAEPSWVERGLRLLGEEIVKHPRDMMEEPEFADMMGMQHNDRKGAPYRADVLKALEQGDMKTDRLLNLHPLDAPPAQAIPEVGPDNNAPVKKRWSDFTPEEQAIRRRLAKDMKSPSPDPSDPSFDPTRYDWSE